MTSVNTKAVTIKLNATGDLEFGRDSWYGWGPFKAKLNDDKSLVFRGPDSTDQVVGIKSNDRGDFYQIQMGGGVAFATVVDHEQYGRYLRIRLGNKVALPEAVMAKMAGPKGVSKPAAAPSGGSIW